MTEDNFCRSCGVDLVRSEEKSDAGRIVVTGDRRGPVGVFLVATGGIVGILSYLMGIVPMLALGLASLLIGIMVLYLPESGGSYADRFATDSSLPSLLNMEKLLEDLDLDEKGIYIPTSGLGVCPKVFVPLADTPATKRPPIGLVNSSRIFVTVGKNPEDRGVLLDAPGGQILAALERSIHVDFAKASLDDLGAELNSGFRTLGLAKVTTLEHQDQVVRVEMQLSALQELEARLRNLAPRLVAQVGTPVASAAAAAVCKATGKYVTLRNAVLNAVDGKISIRLNLSG